MRTRFLPLVTALASCFMLVGVSITAKATVSTGQQFGAFQAAPPDQEASGNAEPSPSAHRDGRYTASGQYLARGGLDSIRVTLTLLDDVVTSVSVLGPATRNASSQRYVQEFAATIHDDVVGVPIGEIDVDRTAGASLTSDGFMRAVTAIAAASLR